MSRFFRLMRGRVGVLNGLWDFGAIFLIWQRFECDRSEKRPAQLLKGLLSLGLRRFQNGELARLQPGMVSLELTRAFAPRKLNTVSLSASDS